MVFHKMENPTKKVSPAETSEDVMSNEYKTRSSRHERRSSRWAKKDFDVVEAAADQATEHLEVTPLTETRQRAARSSFSRHEAVSAPLWLYGLLTGLSVLLGLTFYAFPLWQHVATPLQSQNLYSGLAMHQGLVPYNDFYGSGGSLFYLINWLGNFGGSTWILWLFELVALLISGILSYRLVFQQTRNQMAATIVSAFTLVTITGLARGGDTPTLFALPFALWAAGFIFRYFQEGTTDKGFIRFGMAGAFTFVIAPIMTLFFVLSGVALLIYNLLHRRVGRGFYQLLASILGILLVGYSVAYYALEEQTLYTSIEQSVLIPFSHFGLPDDLLLTLAKALVLILVFGIVTGFAQGILQLKKAGRANIWYVLLLLGIVVVTLIVIFNKSFDSSNLLAVLPYIAVFAGLGVKDSDQILLKYLQNRLFAPILAVLFVIFTPLTYHFLNHKTFSEENAVVHYLNQHAKTSDRVYAVTAGKDINLKSKRVSTIDTVPSNYPVKFTQSYDLKVEKMSDQYVVLQAGQTVPKSLEKALASHYKVANYSGEYFRIYQKK